MALKHKSDLRILVVGVSDGLNTLSRAGLERAGYGQVDTETSSVSAYQRLSVYTGLYDAAVIGDTADRTAASLVTQLRSNANNAPLPLVLQTAANDPREFTQVAQCGADGLVSPHVEPAALDRKVQGAIISRQWQKLSGPQKVRARLSQVAQALGFKISPVMPDKKPASHFQP